MHIRIQHDGWNLQMNTLVNQLKKEFDSLTYCYPQVTSHAKNESAVRRASGMGANHDI